MSVFDRQCSEDVGLLLADGRQPGRWLRIIERNTMMLDAAQFKQRLLKRERRFAGT